LRQPSQFSVAEDPGMQMSRKHRCPATLRSPQGNIKPLHTCLSTLQQRMLN
ncbi:hypothetical protein GOODEAATRI_018814, partial [Goodea atripinnis]